MNDNILKLSPKQFPEGSAELLLWRICASDRCPGLINGEARLCEAFHSEAFDLLSRCIIAKETNEAFDLLSRCIIAKETNERDKNPFDGLHQYPDALAMARVHLRGSPPDLPRLSLRERIPHDPKKLAQMTRKWLSLSRKYHEGARNPLHDPLPKKPIYPACAHGTRHSPCQPFESGPNTLPGMERFKHAR